MPAVPVPEDCDLEETRYLRLIDSEETSPRLKQLYQANLSVSKSAFLYEQLILPCSKERLRSPIAIKRAREHDISEDGTVRYMYWMQARDIPKYEAPFQKVIITLVFDNKRLIRTIIIQQCILSYISDLYLCAISYLYVDPF